MVPKFLFVFLFCFFQCNMIRRVYQFLHIADVMVDAFSEIGFGPRPGAVAAALATGNSDIPCRAELVVGGVADGHQIDLYLRI